jgi:hypothetical protein
MKKNQQSKTKKEKHPIHEDLSAWGDLTKLEEGLSLDFSSSSSLERFGQLGIKISNQATGQLPWPSKLEQLDDLVGKLIRTKPAWGQAIKAYYTSTVAKNKVRVIATHQNISKSTFHDRLQNGRNWISDEIKYLH